MQKSDIWGELSPFLGISTAYAHAKKYAEPFPNAVQEILQSMYVDDVLAGTSKGVTWKFITKRSPWRGGWWERFSRAIKAPLLKGVGEGLLTYSESREKSRESSTRKETRVRGARKERELLQQSFPARKPQGTTKRENCHRKQEMCQPLVSYLHRAKPNATVTLVSQEQNITISWPTS